jgi:nucleotide-binding universal stress UspA family protein
VKVDVALVEGQEKGPIIAEEAKSQRVSLLVIGQRKQSSSLWCLLKRCAGNKDGGGVADYCIQNASCMTIAVRRKSRKLGGYLITTKRHKNFWLLA